MSEINFKNLFILDLANNHQGDVDHGLNIINQCGDMVKKHGVRAGIKFQFRNIDTFIHPDFKEREDVKHIKRFTGTRLELSDYSKFLNEIKNNNMISICTPFDEVSVDHIIDLDIDIIKVASCSAQDWPLLKKIVKAKKLVIASTAGLTLDKIDKLVAFFKSHNMHFAIMHCVAIYPTPDDALQLNQIDLLKNRYMDVPIGFSTHEDQDNLSAIQIAYAKGAELFERHVGLNTEKYVLNKYSSTPMQLDAWMNSFKKAVMMCGPKQRKPVSIDEKESLLTLKRGVYAAKAIKQGDVLTNDNTFFAMPAQSGQLLSDNFYDGMTADKNYEAQTMLDNCLAEHGKADAEIVFDIILQVRAMLNKARIYTESDSSLELSHHYGLSRFREYGCVIVNCINREYCKKLIIQLPRQKHPYHMHKRKEETFQLLYGDLEVELDGERKKLLLGDTLLVEKNTWHKFHTLDGAIFEEVSTTHYNDDSFYEDEGIAKMSRNERKTIISNWRCLNQFANDLTQQQRSIASSSDKIPENV